jgi:uncharacterized repeat protein (TIGR03803 family)
MQCNKGKRRLPPLVRDWALCAALAVAAGSASAAPIETVLYSFTGSDGAKPVAGLIVDSSGNLYGTTVNGGAGPCNNGTGCGVVFKVSPSGTETVLHSFIESDGAFPEAGLIADSSGNLYGTTVNGGAGNGVVFMLSPGGTETVLHSFTGSDGRNPQAGLIADSAGNFYGTTVNGGASDNGVVFKLSPGGIETVLYSFCSKPNCSDGANPQAGLLLDSAGNLYGTTEGGGNSSEAGVVFKLSPSGTETVLHSFCSLSNCSDGAFPQAGLIVDRAGNLYGTTVNGGLPLAGTAGAGVVFKLSPRGTETVLYSFCMKPNCSDGASPQSGLIVDRTGNFYGTTYNGGASNSGVVFKLSPSRTETVLYSFTGGSDGNNPQAGLTADSAGNLY